MLIRNHSIFVRSKELSPQIETRTSSPEKTAALAAAATTFVESKENIPIRDSSSSTVTVAEEVKEARGKLYAIVSLVVVSHQIFYHFRSLLFC